MKEDKLKKIIQSVELDDPGLPFTDGIMEIIQTREELKLAPAILSVLETELLAEPPFQFTENLMASIKPAQNRIPNPIISRKFWLLVSGIATFTLITVLLNSHSQSKHLSHNLYFKI